MGAFGRLLFLGAKRIVERRPQESNFERRAEPYPTGATVPARTNPAFLAAEDTPAPKATAPEPSRRTQPRQSLHKQQKNPLSLTAMASSRTRGRRSLRRRCRSLGIDADSVDVDEDGTIKVKTKIDGTEGTAKLQDLLRSLPASGAHRQQGTRCR